MSRDERIVVADGRRANRAVRAIAADLGRHPSTVSREIKRNSDPETGEYHPFQAHQRAAGRRPRPKEGKLAGNGELREVVQDHLEQRWSPEQISNSLPGAFPDRPEMRVARWRLICSGLHFTHSLACIKDANSGSSNLLAFGRRPRSSARFCAA